MRHIRQDIPVNQQSHPSVYWLISVWQKSGKMQATPPAFPQKSRGVEQIRAGGMPYALAMASFRLFLVCSRSLFSSSLGLNTRLKMMVHTAATTTAM